jgi:hypothetical protein
MANVRLANRVERRKGAEPLIEELTGSRTQALARKQAHNLM